MSCETGSLGTEVVIDALAVVGLGSSTRVGLGGGTGVGLEGVSFGLLGFVFVAWMC